MYGGKARINIILEEIINMTKYILLVVSFLLVLSSESSMAQHSPDKKMFFLFEAGVFPRFGEVKVGGESFDSKGAGTTLRFTAGYSVNPNFMIGLGVGTDNFRDPVINTFPIFADFRGFLSRDESSPFGFYKLGYGFKMGEHYDQGFINNVGFGYQIAIGSRFISPSIGYHRLEFKQQGSFRGDVSHTKGSIHSLSIMVGYQF